MKKLYSAMYADDCQPFHVLLNEGGEIEAVRDPDQLKEHDAALIVWGGADINPALYKHPMHTTTHPSGLRDRLEWALMQRAIEVGMPIIGVCRGAQMLCAAAGGYLLQDVHGHFGNHLVTTFDGGQFPVNSIHHQMMAGLEKVDHELVCWSATRLGEKYGYSYMDNQEYVPVDGWKEPEFVYFPKINGYAVQWHPEGMDNDSVATKFVLNYIKKKEQNRADQFSVITCGC
jgi:putative glutamine amidotransferase